MQSKANCVAEISNHNQITSVERISEVLKSVYSKCATCKN